MTPDTRSWFARHKSLLAGVGLLLAVTVIAVLAALHGPGHGSSPPADADTAADGPHAAAAPHHAGADHPRTGRSDVHSGPPTVEPTHGATPAP